MFAVRSSQFAVRVIYSLIPKTKKQFIIFMLAISALAFLVLYHYAGVSSFWLDELFSVGSIRNGLSFSECMHIYKYEETNAPLYFIFAFFWYRLVPHTEQALLSLSIIFTLLAAIMTGLIGEKLSGIKIGILSFLFMLFSRTNLAHAAYEFRAYSLLILVASVNIYFYLSRFHNESWLNIILYGVSMSLLPYTHYVSVLLCFGLFLADCVLIARKHAGFKVIISYFIGALLFLPWFVLFMLPRLGGYAAFWASAPSIVSIFDISRWLTSSRSFFDLPFLAALTGTIYAISHTRNNKFLCSGLFASAFMILISFIYCRFINPKGSFFVNRYFFVVIPFVNLITALGTDYIYTKLKPVFKDKNFLIFTVILSAFCFINLLSIRHENASGHVQPYREVAELIYQNEQSFSGKSAVITTEPAIFLDGWEELYLTADHTREIPTIFKTIEAPLEQIKAGDYERIYLCYLHYDLGNSELTDWLKGNYYFGERVKGYRFHILERMK